MSEIHKITIGRTTQQLLQDFKDRGQEISKSHLLQLTKDLKLREEGLVSVQSIWTEKGPRNTNLYTKEGCRKIIMSVNKMFTEEKKQYLIESTKPKTMSLVEIKQFGLALASMSDELIEVKEEVKLLQNNQNMCRVSAINDNELLKLQEWIIKHRLHKKKLSWNDNSMRQTEYQYLRSYLGKEIGISRVTNLNTKEHKIVRDELLGIMDREGIPY